ncbi:hypothetical protein BMWSH_5014 [Priestia megaterium WSH-002]|jgi:hypothetical protein|uniref:Uncharacterized protein n=1 Tax=Priestia megaterium (strain WSH-002) TaxID=1006007 RepID=A0A8D3X6A0_PRIMW|nr:hypothetical protein BMWSH_5014 [Priestia megaterium WSH-002]
MKGEAGISFTSLAILTYVIIVNISVYYLNVHDKIEKMNMC